MNHISPRLKEKLAFKANNSRFSIFSAGGHFVHWSGTVLAILVEGLLSNKGWSGGAMVLCKLPVPGRPTILITVGQGPIALAVGAGGGGLDIFTLIYPFSSVSLSLGDGPI